MPPLRRVPRGHAALAPVPTPLRSSHLGDPGAPRRNRQIKLNRVQVRIVNARVTERTGREPADTGRANNRKALWVKALCSHAQMLYFSEKEKHTETEPAGFCSVCKRTFHRFRVNSDGVRVVSLKRLVQYRTSRRRRRASATWV